MGEQCKAVCSKLQSELDEGFALLQVSPQDVLGELQKGLVVVVGGDSSDSSELLKVARNADLLIHEATLENAHHQTCIERGHSTPSKC